MLASEIARVASRNRLALPFEPVVMLFERAATELGASIEPRDRMPAATELRDLLAAIDARQRLRERRGGLHRAAGLSEGVASVQPGRLFDGDHAAAAGALPTRHPVAWSRSRRFPLARLAFVAHTLVSLAVVGNSQYAIDGAAIVVIGS